MKKKDFYKRSVKAFEKQLPLVLFRLPGDMKLQMYIQNSPALNVFSNINQSGFIFAPFDSRFESVILPFNESRYYCVEKSENEDNSSVQKNSGFNDSEDSIAKESHIDLVKNAKKLIARKIADKIVVARQEKIEIDFIDVAELFARIERKYKNAFVYLWFHPETGMWAGATPEKMFTLRDGTFETMALAGTQPWKDGEELTWKQKEKQEQHYVTEFIIDALQKFVDLKSISQPYTVRAGNLAHIRTDISGALKRKEELLELIEALHPTPATCGLPKQVAKNFILENELNSRAYYTGYLGVFDLSDAIFLFVNLRCINVLENKAVLYVGGGITAASDPEKEWQETKEKTATMRSIF